MIPTILAATAEADLPVWKELAKTFQIKWPFFIAQLVNFVLVILVLKKFAFGPVQAILEERKQRIANGEEKLAEIEKKMADSEQRVAEKLDEANADAQRLIDEARENAAAVGEKETQKAIASAQAIRSKAEEDIKSERELMKSAIKAEFGKLVTAATTQVSGKVLTDDDQRRINEESMTTLSSN